MSNRALAYVSPQLVRAIAFLSAPLVGVLMVKHTSIGIAATAALVYVPVVFLNLPVALVIWAPLTFMTGVHFPASGPAVIAVLLLAAWIGTWPTARRQRAAVLARERWLVVAIVAFLVWNALSIMWAESSHAGLESFTEWLIVGAIFIVVATAINKPRYARWMLLAFVLGGVASVAIGLASTGLHAAPEIASESAAEGRLTGGSTDPNYLSAGLVASLIVAVALFAVLRGTLTRWVVGGSIVILVAGIIAAESRGALLAALVAAVAAFVLFKRSRLALGAGLLTLVGLAAGWVAADPSALSRLSNFSGTGTGRTELWEIALRVGKAHPFVGVGLGNFQTQEAHYVQQPGILRNVAMVVEQPHVVHNMYLQAFAETGIVGFLLLAVVVVALVAAALRAARDFEGAGHMDLATLARAVAVAQISVFVSLIFLSDGPDERFWVLFGMSAALSGIATGARGQVARRARAGSPSPATLA